MHPFTLCPPEFVTRWEHATLRRWLTMPAKLKLTYALVEQIVELKRDGLCDADIIAAIGVHQVTFYRWL